MGRGLSGLRVIGPKILAVAGAAPASAVIVYVGVVVVGVEAAVEVVVSIGGGE